MLASRAVERGFEPQLGEAKYYDIGTCCFFGKQAALKNKIKHYLVGNDDNVPEWSDMSTCELLFQ